MLTTGNDGGYVSRLTSTIPRYGSLINARTGRFVRWLNSPPGRGVLKCSIAYTIASLGTFAKPLSSFLGRPEGKHVVATMTVYFHPARSAGSMIEAILLAIVAVLYAEIVSLLSMATSMLVGSVWGRVTLAHVLVVVVFVGGGFGFIGWVKQKMGNPLANVAGTLASLAIIGVVTKENAVVENAFSNQKIVQVLKMLVMAITSTSCVNLLIWRVSARGLLRTYMTKVSNSLGDMLFMVSRSFLDGAEDDLALTEFSTALSSYSSLHPQMMKNLREAKFEHYFVGEVQLYAAERSVVKSMEALAQSIGGLRSGASTLFVLLKETSQPPLRSPPQLQAANTESPIISPPILPTESPGIDSMPIVSPSFGPLDFFNIFMSSIRDPMTALVSEIRETLRAPHFEGDVDDFSHNLTEALCNFNNARSVALKELYEHPALRDSSSPERQADLEQVAAACGHFTFSLQSLGDEMRKHVDTLDDLKYTARHGKRSWRWMCWWTKNDKRTIRPSPLEEESLVKLISKTAIPKGIPDSMVQRRDSYGWKAAPGASKMMAAISQRVLLVIRNVARDENLFGLKVGIGACLWATLAFVDATRDWYNHYRGEWGLLSFMIVCSMTVGASNTTGSSRFVGSLTGSVLSFINWKLSQGNALALIFLGWLVSCWNFYLILACGRATLGRITMLAYNVSTLYAYSLSAGLDSDDSDDEGGGGAEPDIVQIVKHRILAVTCGILWGLIICRVIWPISARKRFRQGISMLCLQMGMIWRRGPLAILLRSDASQSYLKSGEQAAMQAYASRLESLRQSAVHEFELRGPFPTAATGRIMSLVRRILDNFYAMSLVTQRSGQLTAGEKALLQYTASERAVLCDRICHIFQVVASSMMLEYPLTDAVPNVVSLRTNLLRKVFQFRNEHPGGITQLEEETSVTSDAGVDIVVEETDYALLYAYVLVTGQVADELNALEKEIEELYGVLEDNSGLLK